MEAESWVCVIARVYTSEAPDVRRGRSPNKSHLPRCRTLFENPVLQSFSAIPGSEQIHQAIERIALLLRAFTFYQGVGRERQAVATTIPAVSIESGK